MNIDIKKAVLAQVKDLQGFMYLLMKYEHDFDKTTDVKWAKSKDCENYFKKRIKGRNSIVLLAVYEGKLVGHLSGEVRKANAWRKMKIHGELSDLFVLGEFRSKNVGSLLVQEFFKWAKKKGAATIEVTPYAGNEKAQRFYKKNGFDEYEVTLEKAL